MIKLRYKALLLLATAVSRDALISALHLENFNGDNYPEEIQINHSLRLRIPSATAVQYLEVNNFPISGNEVYFNERQLSSKEVNIYDINDHSPYSTFEQLLNIISKEVNDNNVVTPSSDSHKSLLTEATRSVIVKEYLNNNSSLKEKLMTVDNVQDFAGLLNKAINKINLDVKSSINDDAERIVLDIIKTMMK